MVFIGKLIRSLGCIEKKGRQYPGCNKLGEKEGMGIWQSRNREEGLGHDTFQGKLNKTNFLIKHICSFLYFEGVECVARVSGAPCIYQAVLRAIEISNMGSINVEDKIHALGESLMRKKRK